MDVIHQLNMWREEKRQGGLQILKQQQECMKDVEKEVINEIQTKE